MVDGIALQVGRRSGLISAALVAVDLMATSVTCRRKYMVAVLDMVVAFDMMIYHAENPHHVDSFCGRMWRDKCSTANTDGAR